VGISFVLASTPLTAQDVSLGDAEPADPSPTWRVKLGLGRAVMLAADVGPQDDKLAPLPRLQAAKGLNRVDVVGNRAAFALGELAVRATRPVFVRHAQPG
jgi:hypothetical protein